MSKRFFDPAMGNYPAEMGRDFVVVPGGSSRGVLVL